MQIKGVKEVLPGADVYGLSPEEVYFITVKRKAVSQSAIDRIIEKLRGLGIRCVVIALPDTDDPISVSRYVN